MHAHFRSTHDASQPCFRPGLRASVAAILVGAFFPVVFGVAAFLAGPFTEEGRIAARGLLYSSVPLGVMLPMILRPWTVRIAFTSSGIWYRGMLGVERMLPFEPSMRIRLRFAQRGRREFVDPFRQHRGGYENSLPMTWPEPVVGDGSAVRGSERGFLKRLSDALDEQGHPESRRFDLVVKLYTRDGTLRFPTDLLDRRLAYQLLWQAEKSSVLPAARSRLARGESVSFGRVDLTRDALLVSGERYPLTDLAGVGVGHRIVRFSFANRAVDVRVGSIDNLQTLLTLLDETLHTSGSQLAESR